MRHPIAPLALLLSAGLSGVASGQYVQYATPYATPSYRYVYPAQPAYARGYRWAAPTYSAPFAYQYQYQYARPANPTGYQNRPYYGAYGYGNYSNGSTDGFPPFRGRSWR